MPKFLRSSHFPSVSVEQQNSLEAALNTILQSDYTGSFYALLGSYQRILADNIQREQWPNIHEKLQALFMCGKSVPLDGPMIGIPLSIRDSDYFKETVSHFAQERSHIASIEWMATAWNMTFADTGLWMGKTFEPVTRETVAEKSNDNAHVMATYNSDTTRIGRNYFRDPVVSGFIQSLGLPVLTPLWNLRDRPLATSAEGFDSILTAENLEKEKNIAYSKTGGIFLANNGTSVVPEMNGKDVYQLNYRWPALNPVYPMTRLVDEVVQIDDGIYLGQLVFATRHYSLGRLRLPFCPDLLEIPVGIPYDPDRKHPLDFLWKRFSERGEGVDYGYQNNGYFLMMDPAYAKQIYAENAFPQLRPRCGESGYVELGYDKISATARTNQPVSDFAFGQITDWEDGWSAIAELKEKFTTFLFESSPQKSDPENIEEMRLKNESILQMLKRISTEISKHTKTDDQLHHFERLHRLFRRGIAPKVENGIFKGHGKKGYNVQAEGSQQRDWYGEKAPARGFDYYHGANLNLHMGFRETFNPKSETDIDTSQLFPSAIASMLDHANRSPNLLDITWHSIGKYIFPWSGKSFEKISGRKLSMFLDESVNLAERYPVRVNELKSYLASRPHYALVEKAQKKFWRQPGKYAEHLQSGSWDNGMSDEDKAFWEKEASDHWVDGNNIQDHRIVAADPLFRLIDMNYRVPDPVLQAMSEKGPSPFARQGYIFLGTSDRESVLPMNSDGSTLKKVFQFHYRYPMIGGPAPIGFCLDELVEIADGLFLGQLIYSTALLEPFHSSVDPSRYKYQLFGYFLLMDDIWQHHRKAIKLDTWQE